MNKPYTAFVTPNKRHFIDIYYNSHRYVNLVFINVTNIRILYFLY